MDALFDLLNPGWVGALIGLIGVVLAVISIGLAYHFYRRSGQGAQIDYQVHTIRLLGRAGSKLPKRVTIQFDDTQVESLMLTLVWLWNSGNKTIYGRNIVEQARLRIDVGIGARVLDTLVALTTRPINECRVEKAEDAKSEVPIGFEYLDSGDGCTIGIYHTEASGPVVLRGAVHEMPRGFRKIEYASMGRSHFFNFAQSAWTDLAGAFASAALALAIRLFAGPLPRPDPPLSNATVATLTVLFAGASIVILGMLFNRYRRRYPKSLTLSSQTTIQSSTAPTGTPLLS
jgi:hypothetical protein